MCIVLIIAVINALKISISTNDCVCVVDNIKNQYAKPVVGAQPTRLYSKIKQKPQKEQTLN